MNFTLMHDYHYSLTELDGMIPWERQIYVDLIINKIKEESKK